MNEDIDVLMGQVVMRARATVGDDQARVLRAIVESLMRTMGADDARVLLTLGDVVCDVVVAATPTDVEH